MHEIADFLRGFPPFETAAQPALDAVVAATEIEYFAAGDLLLRAGAEPDSHAFVIRTGHVELIDSGRVIDVVGPGDMVGLPSLVSDLPPGLDARAAEDVLAYRLSSATLLPLLDGRQGLRFVARTVRARITPDPGPAADAGVTDRVRGIARPPVVLAAAATLREVVAAAEATDSSCVLLRLDDGTLGIITDHDLRRRVLARELDLGTPARDVATAPIHSINADASTEEAVLVMLARAIRHVPITEGGEVVGVVEDVDLLAAVSTTPVRVRRSIGRTTTTQELAAAARSIRPAVVASLRAGQSADVVTASLSSLVEAVVAKAVELHLRARELPPVPFAWLVTGSVARGEAVLSSDVDCLLAWSGPDEDPRTRAWMGAFAKDVHRTLADCGLSNDDHGVRADDPRFARSVDAWCSALAGWAEGPTGGQGDIYLAALADAHPVWGHGAWLPAAEDVDATLRVPLVQHTLHRAALHGTPPTGFMRDLVIEGSGEHAGTVDLKQGGLTLVAIGRYAAALTPGAPTSTSGRLTAAAYAGLLPTTDAEDLAQALAVVQSARLHHQRDQLEAGEMPDDHVRPECLTSLERRHLRDAFRLVRRVQQELPTPRQRP